MQIDEEIDGVFRNLTNLNTATSMDKIGTLIEKIYASGSAHAPRTAESLRLAVTHIQQGWPLERRL
jgi:hypothetical protein